MANRYVRDMRCEIRDARYEMRVASCEDRASRIEDRGSRIEDRGSLPFQYLIERAAGVVAPDVAEVINSVASEGIVLVRSRNLTQEVDRTLIADFSDRP